MRAAIEQNPLGTVTPEKAHLDTTKRAAGNREEALLQEDTDSDTSTDPMEAFEGAAQEGFRADISALTDSETTDENSHDDAETTG